MTRAVVSSILSPTLVTRWVPVRVCRGRHRWWWWWWRKDQGGSFVIHRVHMQQLCAGCTHRAHSARVRYSDTDHNNHTHTFRASSSTQFPTRMPVDVLLKAILKSNGNQKRTRNHEIAALRGWTSRGVRAFARSQCHCSRCFLTMRR
jgi:predicted dehydrogenase